MNRPALTDGPAIIPPAAETAPPLFIGLGEACARAATRRGALGEMLGAHRESLALLEQLASADECALELCGRLLGLVLDAANGGDLHALIRLRRGLRLLDAFLHLRAQGPVVLVSRLRTGDPDLRAQLGGVWADIDLRPRRASISALPRYRLRPGPLAPRLERAA